MQNTWQDILVLGLLVLLFGMIHRRRTSVRLVYWIAGWFFVLAHFAALQLRPASYFGQNLQWAVSASGLALAGTCFLLAAMATRLSLRYQFLLGSIASIPALTFIFLVAFDYDRVAPLIFLVNLGECGAIWAGVRFAARRKKILWANNLIALACGTWLLELIAHHQAGMGLNAILTQVFLLNAVLYWEDFRRASVGVVTASVGLVAWAMVFPASAILFHFYPHLLVTSPLWNVPKYFVEFGMILTLMEEQIVDAETQRKQYQLLFDSNPHPMFLYDPQGLKVLRVNDAALVQYGYSREEFLALRVMELVDVSDRVETQKVILREGEDVRTTGPWKHRRKDGSRFHAEISSHSIEFEGRRVRFCMVIDVSDKQRLYEQLEHRANHDPLTNLPNRFHLEQRLRHTLETAARHKQKAAILCIDLDRFKQINDTYGHAVGDICLQEIAGRLKKRLRESDTVARTGGEEFTIVLGDLHADADAEKVAADLLGAFRRQFTVSGVTLDLSASLGIAIYPDHGVDAHQLWRAADLAMYRAKRAGGGRYMKADGMEQSIITLFRPKAETHPPDA
ncbi:MAG: diguanylate cyclase [Acidobacterium ailaaui]|nr:diguanylate cyclase [Pseudacidobacterium ailaaui]MDI3255091.1 diguanylate cyclase [Bacillota bacterium]